MHRFKFTRLTVLTVILLLLAFAGMASAKDGMVNTVLGPIPAEKLGATFMHEHFTFGYNGYLADDTMAPYDLKAIMKKDLEVIKTAQKYGIKTIVDATPNDAGGRSPELYKALSKKTGLNIICSTGLYTEVEGAPAYWKRKQMSGMDIQKMMTELFIKEITDGIGKTKVKAGVIKIGTGPKMTDYEKIVHKAAVAAQKETGVPIITHTEGPLPGIEQADFLLAEGADPKRLMIGHVSNSKDVEYHKAILAKGVYIAFDRLGLDYITPHEVSVKNIAELCKLGYANKIFLSHDTVNVWLGRPTIRSEKVTKMLENWKIDNIHTRVIPDLKAAGVTDEQIKMMLVDNVKNLFLGK